VPSGEPPSVIEVVILALGIGLLDPSEERLTRHAEEGDGGQLAP
jgi:hypothetical protein